MSPIVPLPPSFSVGVQTAELSSVATRECVAYIPEREVPWGGLRWRWAAGNLAPGAGTGDVIDHLCGSRRRDGLPASAARKASAARGAAAFIQAGQLSRAGQLSAYRPERSNAPITLCARNGGLTLE